MSDAVDARVSVQRADEMYPEQEPAITHYLVTLQCEGEPLPGNDMGELLASAFREAGLTPKMAVTYSSKYAVAPMDVGLKDTWLTLTADERNDMIQKHPHLVMALDLLCGITRRELND